MHFRTQDSKSLKHLAKSMGTKVKLGASKSTLSTVEEDQKKHDKEQKKLEKQRRKEEKQLAKSGATGGGFPSSSSTLPSKFDPNSSGGGNSSSLFKRVGSDKRNRDPGVQSDDEDDMFTVRQKP